MPRLTRRGLGAWAAATMLLLGGPFTAGTSRAADVAPLDPPQTVKVAYVPIMKFAAAYVAKQRGIFDNYGLDVQFERVKSGTEAIAFLDQGRLLLNGSPREVFGEPRHPYTHLLLKSAPAPGRRSLIAEDANTELPDPYNPPPGCAFYARCPRHTDQCNAQMPPLEDIGAEEGHRAACFHPHEGR